MAEENVVPLDYAIVLFRGNKFQGEIAPEIYRLSEEGLIRVIDVVFIVKENDGNYTTLELNELSEEEYAQFLPLNQDLNPLFTNEDVAALAALVPPGNAALLILWQNIWTEKLRRAVKNAHGEILVHERVAPEVLNEVLAELKAANTAG